MDKVNKRLLNDCEGKTLASKVLHYLIAEEIIRKIQIKDDNRFLIGSLAPDMSSHDDGTYNTSHYWDYIYKKQLKGINWGKFETHYFQEMRTDDLYLGYYCHLIMDAIWFCLMADRYVRKKPKSERNSYYQKSYNDYRKLNSILRDRYNLTYRIIEIRCIGIEEIKEQKLSSLLTELRMELSSEEEYDISELEIYPFNSILEFINESVETCINEIAAFNGKASHIKPERYFVSI